MSYTLGKSRITPKTRSRYSAKIGFLLIAALIIGLVGYPMVMLIAGSFLGSEPDDIGTGLSVASYLKAMGDVGPLLNTLVTSCGSTALAVGWGVALAWILTRTNIPGAKLLSSLVIIPFYLTPLLGAVGWSILASPGKVGLLNAAIASMTGWSPFNIYTPGGIIWVTGLYLAPFCYLFTAGALASIDSSAEESAQVMGASLWRTARDVSLPLVTPAIAGSALLIFVQAIGQFGIPAVLGMPYGYYVLTTRIYQYTAGFSSNYGAAAALGLILFVIAALALWLQIRIVGLRSYVSISGRGIRAHKIDVRSWRWPLFGIVLGYILLAVVLPLGTIIWSSLLRYMAGSLKDAHYTWANFHYVLFEYPTSRIAIWNSLLLALGGACLTLAVGGIAALLVEATRIPGRRLLQYIILLPLAIPGMVFSIGLLWAWIRFPVLPIYGTLWILLICYLTIYLPYSYRSTAAALSQIHPSLQECANLCGAGPTRVFASITLPLLRPGLWAAWTLLFISIIKELSASTLLTNSETTVLSVAVYELWNNGSFPTVSALALIETAIIFAVLLLARWIGRAGKMQL